MGSTMKAFIAVSCLLAVVSADVSSHQSIRHGHAPATHHAVAHVPHHAPVVHKPAPVHRPAPVVHKPAPIYHPAPAVYLPAPVYHKPAPSYQEPSYDTPAAYAYEYAVA